MKRKDKLMEDLKNLLEYCKYQEWKRDNKEIDFDRGMRFGVEHIRLQIDKVLSGKWSKWNKRNFPSYINSLITEGEKK